MSARIPDPSRSAGLAQLDRFMPNAGTLYTKSRNFDFGPDRRGNVSMLSPWLRHRLVLEQEVLQTTLSHHSLAAAGKFVQEVFWRAYFKGWLEHRPAVWGDYRRSVIRLLQTLGNDASTLRRYEEAVAGETGIECFDAWAKELVDNGYLHNHARMWFASIWVFTLKLPWQLGADFFYRHLLDGDPASNTLSWRWVSGLHTPGKTYFAEPSNIAYFSDNRFRPNARLATRVPSTSKPDVYSIEPIRPSQVIEPGERYGLLITEEDCFPESLLDESAPVAVLGATATRLRSQLPVSSLASEFAAGAVRDAVDRASQAYGVSARLSSSIDWGELLLDWAKQQSVNTIVTAYAPVGPVAELLDAATDTLAENDIRLLQLRRTYDSLVWPHARRGFYKLNEKIPQLLERIGIERDDARGEQQAG